MSESNKNTIFFVVALFAAGTVVVIVLCCGGGLYLQRSAKIEMMKNIEQLEAEQQEIKRREAVALPVYEEAVPNEPETPDEIPVQPPVQPPGSPAK